MTPGQPRAANEAWCGTRANIHVLLSGLKEYFTCALVFARRSVYC
jgi:hypothetical protein